MKSEIWYAVFDPHGQRVGEPKLHRGSAIHVFMMDSIYRLWTDWQLDGYEVREAEVAWKREGGGEHSDEK